MKKGIILYESKYGATKAYVDWLTEMTGFDQLRTKQASVNDIKPYDVIIIAGGIYASGIAGISFLKKNYDAIKHKRIAIFCVGASPYEPNAFRQICEHNQTEALSHLPFYYGRGAWDETKMTRKDRILCKMLQHFVSKQDPSTYEPWQAALMSAVGQTCDWTNQTYLKPLYEWIISEETNETKR